MKQFRTTSPFYAHRRVLCSCHQDQMPDPRNARLNAAAVSPALTPPDPSFRPRERLSRSRTSVFPVRKWRRHEEGEGGPGSGQQARPSKSSPVAAKGVTHVALTHSRSMHSRLFVHHSPEPKVFERDLPFPTCSLSLNCLPDSCAHDTTC